LAVLSPTWVAAAWRHRDAPANKAEANALMLGSWGWQRQQEPITLAGFKVRHGTQLQLSDAQQQRQQRFAAFEALAGGGSNGTLPDGTAVATLLPRLWRLPWTTRTRKFSGTWRSAPSLSLPHAQHRLALPLGRSPPSP
jgi:hypothetical protein